MAVLIHVNRNEEWPDLADAGGAILRAAEIALASETREPEGELSITFVSDDEIRALNQRYLGRDRPTDVIAFELGGSGEPSAEEGPSFLGDVYVAPAVARRNAEDLGVGFGEEILRLVVHGVLHLLGHVHSETGLEGAADGDAEADSAMLRLQEELLRGLIEG